MAKVIWVSIKVLVALVVLSVPLLGVWLASSLAAYFNGPIWWMVACGALLFPVLPLLWEGWASRRYARKLAQKQASVPMAGERSSRWLSTWDRLILRTLTVNLAFLTVLVLAFPERGFLALSTRGDWMLTDVSGPWVAPVREGLFAAAGGLEWLYNASQDNPYREFADPQTKAPPKGQGGQLAEVVVAEVVVAEVAAASDDGIAETTAGGPMHWPPPAELHPLVANMPAEVEKSLESVASYILENEPDPMWRIKALYDYVADRVAYDVEALTGHRPPQDARTVFQTRQAVCAGYARLLVALAELTGDEIVYILGVSRDLNGEVGGGGHAWNAAKVDGKWFLLDATWGAGSVGETGFVKGYNPVYLFTPPHALIATHFPEDPGWQLTDPPLSRGEFLRQPITNARMHASGARLLEPTRSEISVHRAATLTFDNPHGYSITAKLIHNTTHEETRCSISPGPQTTVHCTLPGPGVYQVNYYGSPDPRSSHPFWGRIGVNGG